MCHVSYILYDHSKYLVGKSEALHFDAPGWCHFKCCRSAFCNWVKQPECPFNSSLDQTAVHYIVDLVYTIKRVRQSIVSFYALRVLVVQLRERDLHPFSARVAFIRSHHLAN